MGAGGNSGGGGAPSSNGTVKDAKKESKRNEKNIVQKVVENSLLVRGVNAIKDMGRKSKQNVMDYEGQAAGVTPMRAPFDTPRGDNDNNRKSSEQPKVASQMNAPKSELAGTAGPTDVEMAAVPDAAEIELSEEERLLKNKRKGRKSTILTSRQGLDDQVQLSKKTLLG